MFSIPVFSAIRHGNGFRARVVDPQVIHKGVQHQTIYGLETATQKALQVARSVHLAISCMPVNDYGSHADVEVVVEEVGPED